MRRLFASLLLLLLAPFGACSSSSTETGTSDGGVTECDSQGASCGDGESGCIGCAEGGHCLSELNACNMSDDCLAYGRCLQACVTGDDECTTLCGDEQPEGFSAYSRLVDCVYCKECPVSCNGPSAGCTE